MAVEGYCRVQFHSNVHAVFDWIVGPPHAGKELPGVLALSDAS